MTDTKIINQLANGVGSEEIITSGLTSAPSTGSLPMFIASSGAEGVSYMVACVFFSSYVDGAWALFSSR